MTLGDQAVLGYSHYAIFWERRRERGAVRETGGSDY
jgi:hypothetical protein